MSLRNKLQTVGVFVVISDVNTNQQLVFNVNPDAKPIRLKVRIDQHESELILYLSEKEDPTKSGNDLALVQRAVKVEVPVPTAVQVEPELTLPVVKSTPAQVESEPAPVVPTPPAAKTESSSKKK